MENILQVLCLTKNQREAHMVHLVRGVREIWRCSCLEKDNFILIYEFKCGLMWLSLLHKFIQLNLNSGSNPAHGVSEIRDGEDPWQWSQLEIRLNLLRHSTIPQKQFIIIIMWKIWPSVLSLSLCNTFKGFIVSFFENNSKHQYYTRKNTSTVIILY